VFNKEDNSNKVHYVCVIRIVLCFTPVGKYFLLIHFIRRCFSVNTVVLIVTNVCKEKLEILAKNCYCWK
jgi:hypothetical protein